MRLIEAIINISFYAKFKLVGKIFAVCIFLAIYRFIIWSAGAGGEIGGLCQYIALDKNIC